MTRPILVAVSQRVDHWVERGERRDALDQRLGLWIAEVGGIPVPVPNALEAGRRSGIAAWLDAIRPGAILLSGGNSVGDAPERDRMEQHLLNHALANRLPVLGICRGMQMLALFAGGAVTSVTGHTGSRHHLKTEEEGWPPTVNSYHTLGLRDCPPGYRVSACSEDGGIEAIIEERLGWEGWMWHPEREMTFSEVEINRARSLFSL